MTEIKEEYLIFLDKLRESGRVNMFGAAPHLTRKFDLNSREAGEVLHHWMATFEERHK